MCFIKTQWCENALRKIILVPKKQQKVFLSRGRITRNFNFFISNVFFQFRKKIDKF